MSTELGNRSHSRRWTFVPVVLALCVGLVAGYGFRPTTGAASSRLTANCPKKTGAGTPVGARRYTPGPKSGAVKPLPGKTAVSAVPHLRLGMITRPLAVVQNIQHQVDAGNKKYAFYLLPTETVRHTLPQFGFKPPVQIASPSKPFPRYSGRPVRKAIVKYGGKLYQVRLAQPLRQGAKGVWVIVTILPQTVRLGGIGQPGRVVQHTQQLADKNSKRYGFYRNPNQVVLKNAAQYGLIPPFKLISNASPFKSTTGRPTRHAVVESQGTQYDVYVAQFGKTGSKGVWSYAFIDVRQG